MRIEFLNARHGDCFLVLWGNSHVLVVDGGPDTTYETALRPRLMSLPVGMTQQRVLDMVCVTHVDDDHIVGVQRLLTELHRAIGDPSPGPFLIRRFWFNSVEEIVESEDPGAFAEVEKLLAGPSADSAVGASIDQGRDVRNRATALSLRRNTPLGGLLVEGMQTEMDGLRVTVVAPDMAAVRKLSDKWKRAKKTNDITVISSAYSDRSIPNLSSVVLYVEHAGRTALLTGDARGDRILRGLRRLAILGNDDVLHVDLLKLPHHGSDRNITPEFLRRVHADHYVVSADGIAHHHPHEDVLRWLVESRRDDECYTIHLTNEIDFALNVLRELAVGRSFSINARPPGRQSVVVDLDGDP